MTSPVTAGPRPVNRPCLTPTKVMVTSAFTTISFTDPVSLDNPEGISTDKTGSNELLICSIASAKFSRKSPSKPVPIRLSTMIPSERLQFMVKGLHSTLASRHICLACFVSADMVFKFPNS